MSFTRDIVFKIRKARRLAGSRLSEGVSVRVRPALLILLFGLVPSLANALALGEIKLNSGLNEALDAEIEIVSATREEIKNLSATVATRETFERYGLDRPDFLSGLRFEVIASGGRNVLRVFSSQPISEPFVTFLVEAQWRRGRLLREYTVLLDPPIFLPTPQEAQAPAPAPVLAPRSVRSQSQPRSGQIVRDVPPAPRRAPRNTATPVFGSSYGPIVRNETLWGIAERLRTDRSITMNQMMIAIYQANQDAFLGNINLMKEGSVLRIPERSAIEAVAQPEAYAMAVAHNQAWRAGRPSQVATSGIAPTQVAATPDSSRLRLVEPDDVTAPAGSATAGSSTAGTAIDGATRATLAQNEADIARLSSENEQLRSDLEEIRRLLSVRDTDLAQLQQQLNADGSRPAVAPGATTTATSTPDTTTTRPDATPGTVTDGGIETVAGTTDDPTAAASDPDAATTAGSDTNDTAVVTPPATTTPVVKTLPEKPGLVERALGLVKSAVSSLWLWIGLGVIALAGFGMFALRGRGEEQHDAIEALTREAREQVPSDTSSTMKTQTPVATEVPDVEFFDDSGTFKPVDFSAAKAVEGSSGEYPFEDTVGGEIKLDQSDPLAEADFHMAYGLYDQASDLVKKAITREPKRIDLRMKLLEIFFVWGNESEFRSTAADLRDNMSAEIADEWDKIVIMGKQICPNDDLFAGDAAIGSSPDIDLEFEPTGAQSAVEVQPDSNMGVDLDIGGALGGETVDDTVESGAALDTVNELLDFDLGNEMPMIDDDETRPEPVEEIKDQIRARLSSTDSEETAEMDLSDLGVDLDLAGSSAVTSAPDDADVEQASAQPQEDTDFGDIFEPTGNENDQTSELPSPTTELTAGAGALDLDIGSMFGDLDTEDDEETARDLAALEESMEETGSPVDDAGDTGHFSAEVETLHGDSLDVDISAFNDDEGNETVLIAPDDAVSQAAGTGAEPDAEFSASIFEEEDLAADKTTLLAPDDNATGSHAEDSFSAAIFGEDETVQVPSDIDDPVDSGIDLDIGEELPEVDDRTTAKVATSEMALPGADDELSEVGTKLDLARAYMDMGDPAGARGILEEVLAEGNEGQQADARDLLSNLG